MSSFHKENMESYNSAYEKKVHSLLLMLGTQSAVA
jgi:hypothetical protein